MAQGGRPQASEGMRNAVQLDLTGKYTEARVLLQHEIDTAATPLAKANAQRAMAMWAKTVEYEPQVIAYWVTCEKAEPKNALYMEGEMANEAARWYQQGTELGLREPEISADRTALWEFGLANAKGRIAARRGNKAEAENAVKAARNAIEKMTDSRKQQEPFLPYLTGYVALYLGDAAKALADLEQANQNDAFLCYRKAAATHGHNPLAREKLS